MTMTEEKLLCNCIAVMILILVAGIYLGFRISDSVAKGNLEIKPETYYQQKCCDIYNLTMDYTFEKENVKKNRLYKELKKMVYEYNYETETIKDWKFHCPQRFTLEYLGVKDE